MSSQKYIIGFLILVVLFGGVYIFGSFSKNPINTAGVITNPGETAQEITGTTDNVIEITSSGFTPKTLTISKGETVTWINKDTEEHWPASANHPTHTVYPGSNIEKCGTIEQAGIFDACRGVPPGESWSFTFNEAGTWGYHDHLQSSLTGKIIVK